MFCRCTAFSYLEGDPELAFFAVYDGHGGTGVANYLKDHLHEFILDQPQYKESNIEEATLKAFLQVRKLGPTADFFLTQHKLHETSIFVHDIRGITKMTKIGLQILLVASNTCIMRCK